MRLFIDRLYIIMYIFIFIDRLYMLCISIYVHSFTLSEIQCRYRGPAARFIRIILVWFLLLPVPQLCFILIAVAAMTPEFSSGD